MVGDGFNYGCGDRPCIPEGCIPYLTSLSAARMLSQHLWHSSTCPQGASRMDRGASMHTEQSSEASSSAGTLPPPLLLPLLVAPPVGAGTRSAAAMGRTVEACSFGSWAIDTQVLAGR